MANTNLVPKLANLEHETALTNTDLFMIESSSGEKKYTTIDDLAISGSFSGYIFDNAVGDIDANAAVWGLDLSTLDHPIDIILKDGNTTREWYISTQYITANYITIIGNPDRLDTVWYGGGDNITNHINGKNVTIVYDGSGYTGSTETILLENVTLVPGFGNPPYNMWNCNSSGTVTVRAQNTDFTNIGMYAQGTSIINVYMFDISSIDDDTLTTDATGTINIYRELGSYFDLSTQNPGAPGQITDNVSGVITETDPLSLHLDQTSPQTFTAGDVSGTGLLKVTAGELGLDSTYYISEHNSIFNDDFLGYLQPQWIDGSYTNGTESFLDTVPNGWYQIEMTTLGDMRELNWGGYYPYSVYRKIGSDYFGLGLEMYLSAEVTSSNEVFNMMIGLMGSTLGSELTVNGVTREVASPNRCKVTFTGNHSLDTNNLIRITGIVGVPEANGWFIVEKIDDTSIYLKNSYMAVGSSYSSGGTAYQIKDYILLTFCPNTAVSTHYVGLATGNNGTSDWIYANDGNSGGYNSVGEFKFSIPAPTATSHTALPINFYTRNKYSPTWIDEGSPSTSSTPTAKLQPVMLFNHNNPTGGVTIDFKIDEIKIGHKNYLTILS